MAKHGMVHARRICVKKGEGESIRRKSLCESFGTRMAFCSSNIPRKACEWRNLMLHLTHMRTPNLSELVWQIWRGTVQPWSTQVCETSAPMGSFLIVYRFQVLQTEKCIILLYSVYPPIVKLNSLLGRCTCKEQKQFSENVIYFHY